MSDLGFLEPFDHKKHKPQDVFGNGQLSTEFLATEDAPDGGYWNIPTIWWDSDGNPVHIKNRRDAMDVAREYEERTGKRFPRFKDPYEGEEAARRRSRRGGATKGYLAK